MAALSLSVMLPNRNHGRFIGRAIEAILSQSRPPDELIILDDASTDNSLEVIQSFAHRDPRIQVIVNEHNLGTVKAQNRIISQARGDFLYGAAADDHVLPGFFAAAMEMAQRYSQVGTVFGKYIAVDPEGRQVGVGQVPGWDSGPLHASPERYLEEYLNRVPADHSLGGATVFRLEAVRQDGGLRAELGHYSDGFLAHALALKWGSCYVPRPFMAWSVMPEGFSQAAHQDPKLQLDIMARAAWLMRSEAYRDRYPEAYVRRFERLRRRDVVRRSRGALLRRALAGSDEAPGLPPGGPRVWRIAKLLLRLRPGPAALLRACRALDELRRYPGDVSCYR